jgi:hypothetical protein
LRPSFRPHPASNARDRAKCAYNNAASASRETWIATATTDTYSGIASANWTSASTLSAAAREVTVEGLTSLASCVASLLNINITGHAVDILSSKDFQAHFFISWFYSV